jgi:hypothetical protein
MRNDYVNGFIKIYNDRIEHTWGNYDISNYNEIPKSFNSNINKGIFDKWFHISLYFDTNREIYRLKYVNGESDITIPGIKLIRQFRFWKDIRVWKNKYEKIYIALKTNVNKDYVFLSIDLLINPDKTFYTFSPGYIITYIKYPMSKKVLYGYTPIETRNPKNWNSVMKLKNF